MKLTRKSAVTAGLATIMLLSATSAYAEKGYYFTLNDGSTKKILSKDLTNPSILSLATQYLNEAGTNGLILDLDDLGTANYGEFIAANSTPSLASFTAFATANPADIPADAQVVVSVDANGDATTVKDPEAPASTVDSIDITNDAADAELTVDSADDATLQLWADAFDAAGDTVDADITFESADDTIATVDENGLVTAVGAGEVDITVTAGDVEATFTVTVLAAPVAELAVESVSAINLKNATVTFTKEVDTATVTTTEVKAYINGSATPATVTVTPAADKKSATVVFTSPTKLSQSDSVKFVVDGVKDAAGVAAPKFESTVTVTDVTAPTTNSLEVISNKKVKVYFSEAVDLDTAGIYKTTDAANSGAVLKVDGALSFAKFTAVPGENAVEVDFFNALSNGSHTIELSEVKDFAGFKTVAKSFTVSADADVTAPQVVSVEATAKNKVKVVFNEALESPLSGTFNVYQAGDATDLLASGTAALDGTDTSNKTVLLTLGTPFNVSGTVGFDVKYASVKDAAGNVTSATAATISGKATDDTTKPTVTSATIKTGNVVEIALSETVNAPVNANFVLYKEDGSTLVNATAATVGATTGKTNTYDVTFAGLTNIDAANFKVKVTGLTDTSIRGNVIADAFLPITALDSKSPTLDQATLVADGAGDNDKIVLNFSETIDGTTATNINNYFVGGAEGTNAGVALSTVTGAKVESISADGKKVTLVVPKADTTANGWTTAVDSIAAPALKDATGNLLNNASLSTPASVAAGFTPISASDIEVKATGKNTITVTALNGYSLSAADANSFKFRNAAAIAALNGTGANDQLADLGVVAAQISADGKTVTLTTAVALTADAKADSNDADTIAESLKLYISGTGVKDQNGQVLTIAETAAVSAGHTNLADNITATQSAPTVGTAANANKITFAYDETVTYASVIAGGSQDAILAGGIELKIGTTTLIPNVDYTATISGGAVVVTVTKAGVSAADVSAEIKRADYLTDAAGNAVGTKAATVVSGVTEKTAPTITGVAISNGTTITVTFSEAVSASTIATGAFTLATVNGTDTETVTSTTLSADGKTVTVVASGAVIIANDTITVDNTVTDVAGNVNSTTTAQLL